MKATVHRETFVKASERTLGFIEKKPIIAAYGSYLMHFGERRISITAGNGLHQCTTSVEANCNEDMSLCVEARRLHNIIDSFSEVDIAFSVRKSKDRIIKLIIKSAGGTHELPCFPLEDYVLIKRPDEIKYSLSMDGDALIGMWENISTLVNPKDDQTPQMTGVHITTSDNIPGHIIMEGGTTFRMAVAYLPCDHETLSRWSPIVVSHSVTSKARTAFDLIGSIKIMHSGSGAIITDGLTEIITRCLAGKFPSMTDRLTATRNHSTTRTSITFDHGHAVMCVKRLYHHKHESDINKDMILKVSTEGMVMHYTSHMNGTEGNEDVRVSGNPVPMELGVDIDSFLDSLTACNAPQVEFSYAAPNMPYIITPVTQVPLPYDMAVLCSASVIR